MLDAQEKADYDRWQEARGDWQKQLEAAQAAYEDAGSQDQKLYQTLLAHFPDKAEQQGREPELYGGGEPAAGRGELSEEGQRRSGPGVGGAVYGPHDTGAAAAVREAAGPVRHDAGIRVG